jgi:hypothetical protein
MAIRERSEGDTVRYAPAVWFEERATPARRQRWSRWTRRLTWAGLLDRITEPSRDRVTHVRLTPDGMAWLDEHVGGTSHDLEIDVSVFDDWANSGA